MFFYPKLFLQLNRYRQYLVNKSEFGIDRTIEGKKGNVFDQKISRGERIRTSGLVVPNDAR